MLHNFARDRQHQMDDLLLQEVDAELAAMPIEPVDDANSITSVEVSPEWNDFREELANDMFAEYLLRHGELALEYVV